MHQQPASRGVHVVDVGRRPLLVYDELTGSAPSPPTRARGKRPQRVGRHPNPQHGRQARPAAPGRNDQRTHTGGQARGTWATSTPRPGAVRGLTVKDDRRFRQGCSCRGCRTTRRSMSTAALQPDLNPRQAMDPATLSFVEAEANAAPLGPPGVDKTHIAVALAVCRAGYRATSPVPTTWCATSRPLRPPGG
ncbi:ATP-binding protein [Streptomyces sp. NBC_01005]|nr:ATP-binding protein [Streptomyces sp. NBC_01005]WTD00348.1 ATP-binding protein [Streptomyces sp. NBC_01650]